MSKKRYDSTQFQLRAGRTIGCAILGLIACVGATQTAYAQGDNMCPRGAYVSVHASKDIDIGGDLKRLIDDPTFTIGTFLSVFERFFTTPRLKLKPTQFPEYALTVTFVKLNARYGDPDRSFLAIVIGFIGGELSENDLQRGSPGSSGLYYFYSGVTLLTVLTEAKGFDLASHLPLVRAELAKQKSIDNIIVAYEQIPISATVDEDPWCDYDDNNPNAFQLDFKEFRTAAPRDPWISTSHGVRFIARAEKGLIENGDFLKDDIKAKVFWLPVQDLSVTPLAIHYRPPNGPDKSDTVTLYNSCEVCYTSAVPLNETKKHAKIAEMKVNCKERWNVELTFTKTTAGKEELSEGLTRELGWNYSATVKAVVEFVRSSGSDQIYESKSSTLDFSDNFWHHIILKTEDHTCEGRLSWAGTHNGSIQVPVRMIIHTRANRCSFGFGSRKEADPIIFKIGINLWGDEKCGGPKAWQGQSEVKDVMFDASGTDFPDHIAKPIPFQPGQKSVTGQDQWPSKSWLRFYEVKVSIDPSQFPVESRPLLALLRVTPMMSEKIPANATLTWKATKLGQKD
jgi:hypothetical protein